MLEPIVSLVLRGLVMLTPDQRRQLVTEYNRLQIDQRLVIEGDELEGKRAA